MLDVHTCLSKQNVCLCVCICVCLHECVKALETLLIYNIGASNRGGDQCKFTKHFKTIVSG